MDVLSSQANLAGYRAVIESVEEFGKAVPMMMTAAGTVPAAKVLVIGAGVAGLQAIATAKRMGAIVFATDVRIASKEQVESLGGKFLMVDGAENLETQGGYAKETSTEFKKKQEECNSWWSRYKIDLQEIIKNNSDKHSCQHSRSFKSHKRRLLHQVLTPRKITKDGVKSPSIKISIP